MMPGFEIEGAVGAFFVVIFNFYSIVVDWLLPLGLVHDVRAVGDGRDGVLLAYPSSSLGGVPEQVLQGTGLQIRALQLRPPACRIPPLTILKPDQTPYSYIK